MKVDGHEHHTNPSPAEQHQKPLRICCYGSSSKKTPARFLFEAHSLGLTLATHGHTCVNGAGIAGCMGALNEGVEEGSGNVVGVIHSKFLVDAGGDWMDGSSKVFRRGGGRYGGSVELLVAEGEDLQQRKKMLVDGADAIVVLPGGTGTFDELWEMAASRSVGFIDLPIVCVNVDGYYDSFVTMLQRAYDDDLLYHKPHDILHFEATGAGAVRWIEAELNDRRRRKDGRSEEEGVAKVGGGASSGARLVPREGVSVLGRVCSVLSFGAASRSLFDGGKGRGAGERMRTDTLPFLLAFTAGVFLGVSALGRRPTQGD